MTTKEETGHWAEQKERGSMAAFRGLMFLYRIGGKWVCDVLVYPIVIYFFLTGRRHRRASLQFLKRVYDFDPNHGGMKKPPGLWQVFLHFLQFGYSAVNKLGVWVGSIRRSHMTWPNRPELLEYVKSGKGGVMIGSHLGNLEMLRGIAVQTPGLRFNALVFHEHAQQINAFLTAANPEIDVNLISIESFSPDVAVLLADKVERGEFIVIMGDRHPVGARDRVVNIPFLGQDAAWPTGPFILASLLRCPVFLIFCLRKRRRHFHVHSELFEAECISLPRKTREESLRAVIARYAKAVEKQCCEAPHQWFNFYDFWEGGRSDT